MRWAVVRKSKGRMAKLLCDEVFFCSNHVFDGCGWSVLSIASKTKLIDMIWHYDILRRQHIASLIINVVVCHSTVGGQVDRNMMVSWKSKAKIYAQVWWSLKWRYVGLKSKVANGKCQLQWVMVCGGPARLSCQWHLQSVCDGSQVAFNCTVWYSMVC